jgi:hypothetical protein
MLMTPERSENIPPSAAKMSGVAKRNVERSMQCSISRPFHFLENFCNEATKRITIA